MICRISLGNASSLGRYTLLLFILLGHSMVVAQDAPKAQDAPSTENGAAQGQPTIEASFLSEIRQLTFEGRRAGEGYFGPGGKKLVFQSERDPQNPFFQIFLLDMELGDIQRVSTGVGKTTCGWIHPSGDRVLFASTHEDPQALAKQSEELKRRTEGKEKRYSWDYDPQYELYARELHTKELRRLTYSEGYDAEGSYSPDGRTIVFASNRAAFSEPLSEDAKKRFTLDPSFAVDLYAMDADGGNLRRLTDAPGYDGGPFFSPDGDSICWRRFSPDGSTAEIFTRPLHGDASMEKSLTKLGAMSWAPYFHPSGDYLIFTTNRHGFANFELYLVDAQGAKEPVRVTDTDGFDGLPSFSPDGAKLTWTSNRGPDHQSQIYLAEWNHQAAKAALGLAKTAPRDHIAAPSSPTQEAADEYAFAQTNSKVDQHDLIRHVDYLCRPELGGRLTGTPGEALATAYVAAYFDFLGLEPAGDNGQYFQEFEFTSGATLGPDNRLLWGETPYQVDKDWRPLAFSKVGETKPAAVVFAGYGITAPATEGQTEYDSYAHLDVKGKWVVVFRYLPEDITPERRQHLSPYSSLRYKAMAARDRGASGLVFVSGPQSQVKEQLVPLELDGAFSEGSLPILSVKDEVAGMWINASTSKKLAELQAALDKGEPVMGFELPGVYLTAAIDVEQVKQRGRNVLGKLTAPKASKSEAIIIGAHIDHLGSGSTASSLAKEDERGRPHLGADDNASGVACMMEIAQSLVEEKREGTFTPQRDILFAAWSGEELGLIGSNWFVKQRMHVPEKDQHAPHVPHAQENPSHSNGEESHKETLPHPDDLKREDIVACLNLDMVGRMGSKLILQGVGSSDFWRGAVEARNAPLGLPLTLQEDCYLPTDASSFYLAGVPILSAFTGSHAEYHTPRDTPDRLNFAGMEKIARLMLLTGRGLAVSPDKPVYLAQARPKEMGRARMRAYLGSIPDYAEANVKGVLLSGVTKGAPLEKSGVQAGDVIIELAGKKIENIYDYTFAIEGLKIGESVKIVVQRGEESLQLEVTPGSRE